MLRTIQAILSVAIFFGLAIFISGQPARLLAQSDPAAAPSASPKLTEQETRGEGTFLQRCSLCHLPRKLKFGSPATAGPTLTGLFKMSSPDELKTMRGFILKGGPDMPGFQYALDAKQVDDLIAYLKTL